STSTSPSFGPSRSTVSTDRGFPASQATAARTCIAVSPSGSVLVNHRGSGGPRQRVFAYENEPAAECGRRLCKQNGLERIQPARKERPVEETRGLLRPEGNSEI